MKFRLALIYLVLALGERALALPPNPEHPSGRIDYSIAYVPFLHGVLLYGGWAPPRWRPTSEAWLWKGTAWSRLDMTSAPAFAHHSMAFDSRRNVLVICGRPTPHEGGEYQIWENDGKAWVRKANVPVSASAQGDPKLTYDTRRNRLMLFVASFAGDVELWEFGGQAWQRARFTHRPMRCDDNGCLFQYDESLHKAVLVGEERTEKDPLVWDGREWGMRGGTGTQTWLWDGTDWAQVKGPQPARALWGGIAYDHSRQQLILLTTRMETWTLRRGQWVALSPPTVPSPGPNGFFGLAFDAVRKTSLFFGGESRASEPEQEWTYPEQTWLYDGRTWSLGAAERAKPSVPPGNW